MRRASIASPRGGRAEDDVDEAFQSAPVEILPKEINLSGDADEKLANTLVVTVIQARNLQTAALRSTLSCYVKISSLGRELKTSVVSKSDEPYWNETFSFRAVDWAASVTLSVRDKINVKMRFLGQLQISCTDVAALPGMATQSWFRLRDKNWERKPGMDAELELKVALVYTKKNDPNVSKDLVAGVDMDDDVVGIIADQDDETEEEVAARRLELERLESERKSTMYANLRQGDYQVQVHVIEARDLKGENLSGTSDPYVQVDVMGHKKKTSTKYETLGCVFDEILFFHFENIGRNELKQASIKLSVYDKETVMKDNLIGAYQLDCLSVYFRPHHELYRQWVAVHDHLNEKDRGVQGFLLVSITLIGPGDTFLVHNREAEIAKELADAAAAAALASEGRGGAGSSSANFSTVTLAALNPDGQTLVLMPPTIELKLHYLVVKVVKAEDLPAMDQGGLIVASGIDAFVQIGFGANPACKSSVVTIKGASHLAPDFLEELWIPVISPTLCRHISISVWDRDIGRKDELVGVTSYDYLRVVAATSAGGIFAPADIASMTATKQQRELELSDILEEKATAPDGVVELRWFNLYGPPLRRVNKRRSMWISQNPEFGSTYRGRVLVSMERVEQPLPEESEKFHTKRMRETSLMALEPRLPKTVKYVLRCALFCGMDLPVFVSSFTGATTKARVIVSIGPYELCFETLTVGKDGRINWEECKERWPIVLPSDLTQLPDIVVTLGRQIEKDTFVSASFARVSASEYLKQGFNAKCQWVRLQEEVARRQTRYVLDKSQSPGSLLLRLGFGREEVAVRTPWGDETSLFSSFRHHRVYREIRVHVFQFRKLLLPESKLKPPNPFVSVRCCGQVKRTSSKSKTLDPLYYETLVFITHVPHDVEYSPDLIFYVHDANVSNSTSTNIPGAILGELRISMTKAQRAVANASPARPSWHPLSTRPVCHDGELTSLVIEEPHGEALISVQYIDHQGPIQNVFPPDSKALVPEYEDANLEIVALGVRKLKSRSLLGIRNPQVEFELTGALFSDGASTRTTKPVLSASGTNGKNANFLERVVLPAKLPVDTLYAPQLNIRVVEVTMGGLRKTVIASCAVDLADKLPWSSSYVPQEQEHQVFSSPTTVSAYANTSGETAKRKKSVLDLFRLRRNSQPLVQTEDTGGDPLIDDEEHDDGEDDRVNDVMRETDDGIGVGQLNRTVQPSPWSYRSDTLTDDPAMKDQVAQEEHRRYLAGQADLLRGGVAGKLYQPPSEAYVPREAEIGDEGHGDASYLKGREWWINQGGEELERFLKVKALETYPLYSSVLTRPSLLKRKRMRVQVKAGIFKGFITVSEKRKKRDLSQATASVIDLERLKELQAVVVRVYVLRGCNLQSKDLNGYSDPYLRIKLGKEVQSDRANHKKKTLNPDFFRVFTFNTTLPGPSQLEIGVWDHDLITRDEFIGSTTIDLEDRWFHRDWQRIGRGDSPGTLPLKPIENRHIYTPMRTTPQGLVQVWVDILTAQQAALLPPTKIELPAPRKFEIRVIIWRAENVTDKDQSEVNDYFVKVWMEGGKAENTDVHWRCSNGKPCWNWRFKFATEYPLRTAEFARLHIQLWDKDVIKWNDVIGEAQLDLYKWLRRAYETNCSVTPFLELKNLSKTRSDGSGHIKDGADSPKDLDNGGEEDEEEGEEEDEEDSDDNRHKRGYGSKENATLLQRNQGKLKDTNHVNLRMSAKKPKFLDKQRQKRAKEDKRKTKEARESNEARLALNGLLDFIGMGSLPDEAEWVTIYYTDRESAVSMDMGRIGVSVQVVPEKEAQMNPVGKGQEAPNVNPYLAPPVGRIRLTANPIMMLKELVGPKMCLRIALACCCVGCVMCIGVFGATIMSTLTFIEEMERSEGPRGVAYELPNLPYVNNGTW